MIRISLISKHYKQIEPLIHQFFDNLQVEYILTNYTHQSIQDIYFVEIEKKDDLNILNHLKKLESTLIYIIGPKDFDLVSICLQKQTHLYFINSELEKQFIHYQDFIKKQIQKNFLIDHQAQGEKYNSDNSKILDNFSESIGKDFVMYFEIFSIICVPVYL